MVKTQNMITLLTLVLILFTALYFYQDIKRLKWRSDVYFSATTLLILGVIYLSLDWGRNLFLGLGLIVAINTLVSQFYRPKQILSPILVLVSAAVLLVLGGETLNWNEYQLQVNDPFNLGYVALGAILPILVNLKSNFLTRWFKIDFKNQRTLERGILIFLLGISLMVSQFVSSVMGPLFVTFGFLSVSIYEEKNHNSLGIALATLVFSLLPFLLKMGGNELLNLAQGKLLLGFFFGWGIALVGHVLSKARMKKTMPFVVSTILGFALTVLLLFAGTQNTNFGGWDAFVSLLLGFALPLMAGLNLKWGNYGWVLLFAFGTILQPVLKKMEPEVKTIEVAQDPETGETIADPFDVKGITPNLAGEYQFASETSLLTFELGPKGGRTQGAIEMFTGELAIMEGNQLWVEVMMPMNTLTTFNKYRDESLMEEGYFNVNKFPTAEFTGEAIMGTGETLSMKGNLSLLGVSKEVEVELKQVADENGKKVLLGKSQFDRTNFGMKSDPKEGNVVDIRFKLLLNQK